MIAMPILWGASAIVVISSSCAADGNVPEGDRALVAALIKDALRPQMAMAAWRQEPLEEKHREEIKVEIGPIKKTIVTYWWSRIAGDASFRDPANTLQVTVPKMIRSKERSTISVAASAPVDGNVSGEVLADGSKSKLVGAKSAFHCTLAMSADLTVTREMKDGKALYKIEIVNWAPTVQNLTFDDQLVDKVNGPLQNLANSKLKARADELKDTINKALLDAYEKGRLSLP